MLLLFVFKNLIRLAERKEYMLPNTLHFLHTPAGEHYNDGLPGFPRSWKIMENPGKINFLGKSWKIDKNSQVMEKLKNH